MEHLDLQTATAKLKEFVEWVQWNKGGRQQQIQYLKDRFYSTRNKRLKAGIKKEVTRLQNEKPWST